jgi:hypothetical protein
MNKWIKHLYTGGGRWLFVTQVSVVIVFLLAKSNYDILQARMRDYQTWQTYENLKGLVMSSGEEDRKVPVVFVFNQSGPGNLPYPLEHIFVPDQTNVDFMIRFWLHGFADIRLLQIRHSLGHRAYRLVMFNGRAWEQRIRVLGDNSKGG